MQKSKKQEMFCKDMIFEMMEMILDMPASF